MAALSQCTISQLHWLGNYIHAAVFVNGAGQLGTTTSSRRFKHQIADMGVESDVLMKLRPVAFYYKPELDETQTRQYGLVAEEVAHVAPQLVVFDQDGALPLCQRHAPERGPEAAATD